MRLRTISFGGSTPQLGVALVAVVASVTTVGAAVVTPRPIDAPGLRREIAALKGKVVVVNLWATWCSGCMDEFPDLARVEKADNTAGMRLLTVSFDDAKNIPKAVTPFLAKMHLTTGIFVNKTGTVMDESYPTLFEPKLSSDDPFGLPRTYIYDRRGKLVKVFVGAQTYAGFQKVIQPLLKER